MNTASNNPLRAANTPELVHGFARLSRGTYVGLRNTAERLLDVLESELRQRADSGDFVAARALGKMSVAA